MRPQKGQFNFGEEFAALNNASDALQASLKASGKNPKGVSRKSHVAKMKERGDSAVRNIHENWREFKTREAVMSNPGITTDELQRRADAGNPLEVSGDALARAREGQTPKYHRGVQ